MHQISSKKKDQYESTIPELKREEEQKFAQRSATRRRRKWRNQEGAYIRNKREVKQKFASNLRKPTKTFFKGVNAAKREIIGRTAEAKI